MDCPPYYWVSPGRKLKNQRVKILPAPSKCWRNEREARIHRAGGQGSQFSSGQELNVQVQEEQKGILKVHFHSSPPNTSTELPSPCELGLFVSYAVGGGRQGKYSPPGHKAFNCSLEGGWREKYFYPFNRRKWVKILIRLIYHINIFGVFSRLSNSRTTSHYLVPGYCYFLPKWLQQVPSWSLCLQSCPL